MAKGFVNAIYKMTESAKEAAKRPSTVKRIKRGFESAMDSVEDKLVDLDADIHDTKVKIAGGDIQAIKTLVDLTLERKSEEQVLETLQELQTEAFETEMEVPEEAAEA